MKPLSRVDNSQIQQMFEKQFVTSLEKSGYFAEIRSKSGSGIHIDADMVNYGNSAAAVGGGLIGGLSLMTIPVWATDGYKMTANVTTAKGVKKEYVLDDAVVTVIWLPMVVLCPFFNPITAVPAVWENMNKTLISKMQQDGLLQSNK